jgi:hypothetical protein
MLTVFLVIACSACDWPFVCHRDGAQTSSDRCQQTALVTVPLATQTSVTYAYDLLHEACLRVAIPETFTITSLWEPGPAKQDPRAGSRVPPGTVVTLQLQDGPLGSPAWNPHTVVVPDFISLTASAAVEWIDAAGLFYEIKDIGPLLPSDTPHLLDAYWVKTQSPAAGSELTPGVIGQEGGFTPTPVSLVVTPCIKRGLAADCNHLTPFSG